MSYPAYRVAAAHVAPVFLDLAAGVEPKQFHDVVGYYNRFDIFHLTVDRSENRPIRFAGPGDELLAGERCVVLELAGSEAIFLREVGAGPLHVHVLARSLGALIRAPQLLAQGG